jgi:hypothetical protein
VVFQTQFPNPARRVLAGRIALQYFDFRAPPDPFIGLTLA